MIKRLLSWLSVKLLSRDNRQLFVFWDGSRHRKIDPIEAWHGLHHHANFNDELHPSGVDRGDQEAIEVTCQAVRDVFGVKRFDPQSETGLPVLETLAIYALFCGYLELLKKSTSSTPTLPSSLEDSTSTASEPETTSVTSDSG